MLETRSYLAVLLTIFLRFFFGKNKAGNIYVPLTKKKMDTLRQKIVDILKIVASDKKIDQNLFSKLEAPINLRNELQLDSLDLAELGVRIEDAFGLDIFENGSIVTLGDLIERIKEHSTSSISTHG